MPGTLYIIATPIGNLGDLSKRTIECLQQCDFLFVEDTRVSIKLLNYLGIKKKLISCHEHNEKQRISLLEKASHENKSVGILSDAGVPAISDPGDQVIKKAIDLAMKVVPVPGASAFLLALTASGLNAERFAFEGFLPDKISDAKDRLEQIASDSRTLIFYVSPHKLLKTLRSILEILGDRKACLAREITKLYEEFRRGNLSEILTQVETAPIKGEFVLVLAGADQDSQADRNIAGQQALSEFIQLQLNTGRSIKDISVDCAQRFRISKSQAYKSALELYKCGEGNE